jgi:LacI family transcriptional regulator
MRGAKNVGAATREKVQRAVQELGYVPSAVAQGLRSKRTRSLALILPDITNTFWTTVARGVEDVAQRHDYSVLLCNSDENLAKQQRYLDFVIGQQVDGVIIAPYDADDGHLEKLRRRDIPTVLVDRRIEGWDIDSVIAGSVSGARALVRHLIGLGHTRIAVVSGPAITSTAEDRVLGYCMALAEAGIPADPRLIRRGEFRAASGAELTRQLLDEEPGVTAIFAANNPIAMGVISALEQRGLRVPQDIALVCYDDIPIVSHFFPFLTAVDQPAYDMGLNAAQLLLSRLDSEVALQPRHVVLPTRLIIRHSCGHTLRNGVRGVLSIPLPKNEAMSAMLVKPLSSEGRGEGVSGAEAMVMPLGRRSNRLLDRDKSDVNRLLAVLRHSEADRVPHLELQVSSRRIVRYVLEHELEVDAAGERIGAPAIAPEDQVEFAQRLGMDAVPCRLIWHPRSSNPGDLEPAPSLSAQLSYVERYLRAVQGTGVGVFASFGSFFSPARLAAGADPVLADRHMDVILEQQERAVRVVCDRFGEDLAFILINDDIADASGLLLPEQRFVQTFSPRMRRLIAPAHEHGKLVVLHSHGRVGAALSLLSDIGFDAVHPTDPEHNDVVEIRHQWQGKMALVDSIPTALLIQGRRDEIEEKVRECCMRLAPGGGYVLSTGRGLTDGIPPESFVIMTHAMHRFGRYGALGVAARL